MTQHNDIHPTMKPISLISKLIVNSSKKGEIIMDPTAGSGTVLMACEQTGRRARIVEYSPKYCHAIIERWEKFTGKKAELVERVK